MVFPKVRTQATNKGGVVQVGSLYSCKWTSSPISTIERGWDMLMLIRVHYIDVVPARYVFYDLIHDVERNIGRKLARHCKEITKETICTR